MFFKGIIMPNTINQIEIDKAKNNIKNLINKKAKNTTTMTLNTKD